MNDSLPYLGFGLGLRPEHFDEICETLPLVDWFEILTENYLVAGGRSLDYLDRIRQHYSMVMHGVSLSLGSTDELDIHYLNQVKALAKRIEPVWISDHLCWSGAHGIYSHDLLPLPYTEESITHVVERIQKVQEILQRRILVENVSSYLTFNSSVMFEWEFLAEVVNRADCYILLDINNIYVSAFNHSFSAEHYLNSIPAKRVKQIHLAGHTHKGNYLLDTHDAPVIKAVWKLYKKSLLKYGAISTMIEWDTNLPPLAILLRELDKARAIANEMVISA